MSRSTSLTVSQRAEIQRVFAAQQVQALELRRSTAAQRIERLRALRDAVERHEQDICAACHADFRKPAVEVRLGEILPFHAQARQAIRHTARWMKARRVATPLALAGTTSEIRCEPRGVCLIIAPWNYPFNLALSPLVTALAAGNTAIIKPSELTPQVSALIRRLVSETFPDDLVAVFEGDQHVAQALLELPFNHIFFTGSPAVGRIVMTAAAKHLASVTLELGGKSPVIVDRSADLRQAARDIMWGKLANNGQTCIAPDHIYVHEAVRDDFVAEAEQAVRRAYGDSTEARLASPDYCRIVNDRHFQRLLSLYTEASAGGATTLFGGQTDAAQRYFAPTLVSNVPAGSRLLEEEIFGPILPLLPFTDLEQVLADINARPKPLALYVFARDRDLVERVLSATSAGGSCVNHNLLHYLNGELPFGGVNGSGIGKSHGVHGFREFSNQRAVLTSRRSIAHWLYPPYTPRVRRLVGLAMRFLR